MENATLNYKSNLKVLLAKRNMSSRKLSSLTGLSSVTVSKILNNKLESATLGMLNKICSALECNLNELIIH